MKSESFEEAFSTEDEEILEQFGKGLRRLMNGELDPQTMAQKRFVEISDGTRQPEARHERLWWKHIQRMRLE